MHHCTFKGCPKKTVEFVGLPPEGWTYLAGWGPGVPDGMYCQEHADALEELHLSGELEEEQQRATRSRGGPPPNA